MYFRWLQILRGFAALSVLLYHINVYMSEVILGDKTTSFRIFGSLFSRGWCFFFVVSGFLMAYQLDGHHKRFLFRRLLRIFPTFWLAALGAIAFRYALFGTIADPRVIPLMGLLPLGPLATGLTYPLGIEWTLVYEVFFYVVCAVFANRWLDRWFLPFLAFWLVALLAAARFYHAGGTAWYQFPMWYNIAFSPFNTLFILGGISYHVYKRIPTVAASHALACIAAAVALFSFSEWMAANPHMLRTLASAGINSFYPHMILDALAFTLVLVPLSVRDKSVKKAAKPSLLERFGDYSYALYLIHPTVISSLYLTAQHYPANHNALQWLTLIYCLALGWWYGKVDMWIHDSFRRLLFGKPVKRPEPAGVTLAETVRTPATTIPGGGGTTVTTAIAGGGEHA